MDPFTIGFGVVLIGLAAYLYKVNSQSTSVMTPERRVIFQQALAKDNPALSPEGLEALAVEYDRYGFPHEATILRKRARMYRWTDQEKANAKAAYQRGMSSNDPVYVRGLANAFEAETAFAIAESLRVYANSLDAGSAVANVAAQNAASYVETAQQQAQDLQNIASTLNQIPNSTLGQVASGLGVVPAGAPAAPAGGSPTNDVVAAGPPSGVPTDDSVASAIAAIPGMAASIVNAVTGQAAASTPTPGA